MGKKPLFSSLSLGRRWWSCGLDRWSLAREVNIIVTWSLIVLKKWRLPVAWNSSDCFESFSPLNNWGSNNDSKKSHEIQAQASSVNIYSPLSRLRRDNQTLLSQLKQGQNDTWDVLKRMRSIDDSFVTRTDGESSFTYRGADRTPASVTRRTDQGSTKAGQTSTPKNFQQALMSCGNDSRNRTSVVPVSILSTPRNRKKVSVQTNVHAYMLVQL